MIAVLYRGYQCQVVFCHLDREHFDIMWVTSWPSGWPGRITVHVSEVREIPC